ncbi:RNI-like protein [Rhizophagus irregularis]|uniref:RNI-like protein n=1 Tax=Rhizophagus irregularis TaxID=588596 RepID=A0A2I1HGP2_9GLOM|nr:RNI-like protein [Rhizophagus irregularis]
MLWKEIGYQYGYLPDCDRLRKVLCSRPYPPPGLQHVRKLAIMCFDNCMDKKDVSYIVQNCKELHTIIIQCELVTDKDMIDILRNLQSLNVSLSDIGFVDIFRISVESPSLAQLVLKYCDNITDAAIVNIANKCPYLQHISLKGCGEITDVSVKELARKCQNLYYLNLSGCVSVRFANGTMEMLSSRCENLEYFNSKANDACFENNRNRWLTSRDIQLLASRCKRLRFLILEGCSLIDDPAVYEVAKNCAKLEKINLRYCAGIFSQAVFEIAKSCPNLRYIDISGCGNIQDDAVSCMHSVTIL